MACRGVWPHALRGARALRPRCWRSTSSSAWLRAIRAAGRVLAHELRGIRVRVLHGLDGSAADLAAECVRYDAVLERRRWTSPCWAWGPTGMSRSTSPARGSTSGPAWCADAATRAELGERSGASPHGRPRLAAERTGAPRRRDRLDRAGRCARCCWTGRAPPPASLLRAHRRITVVCDRSAAAELPAHRGGHHVCVVLGHREPSISAEHRISHESLERAPSGVDRAQPPDARRGPHRPHADRRAVGGRADASGVAGRGHASGARGGRARHGRERDAVAAARAGARRRAAGDGGDVRLAPARAVPLRGGRRYGLEVGSAFDWRGDWGRMLANELRGMRTAAPSGAARSPRWRCLASSRDCGQDVRTRSGRVAGNRPPSAAGTGTRGAKHTDVSRRAGRRRPRRDRPGPPRGQARLAGGAPVRMTRSSPR